MTYVTLTNDTEQNANYSTLYTEALVSTNHAFENGWTPNAFQEKISESYKSDHLRGVSGSSNETPTIFRSTKPIKIASSINGYTYSQRNFQFDALYEALQTMRGLDEEESLWIDEETYRSACAVLNYLNYKDFLAPRVFAHGGDAVVFSWEIDNTTLQLTISNGIAALGQRKRGVGSIALGYVDLSEESVESLFKRKRLSSDGTSKI